MRFLESKCPNCQKSICLDRRKAFIFSKPIQCEACQYFVQPTILWFTLLSFCLAVMLKFAFHDQIKDFIGNGVSLGLTLFLVFVISNLCSPFLPLKAHHPDE